MTNSSSPDFRGQFHQIKLRYDERRAIVADLKALAKQAFSTQGWDALSIHVSDVDDEGFALAFAGRTYEVRLMNTTTSVQDTFTLSFSELQKQPNNTVKLLLSSYIRLDELGNALSVWSVSSKREISTANYKLEALLAALRHAASAGTGYDWPSPPPAPSAHPA